MFKSLLDWLTSTQPISRWILILMLLGMVCGIAALIRMMKPKENRNGN